MWLFLKLILITILCCLATLTLNKTNLRLVVVFELCWVSVFSLLILLGLLQTDPLFFFIGFLTFVLSAIEVIFLLSIIWLSKPYAG